MLKYRYDAFGGVFTQLWTPYNQVGLSGKSYDIKASLMDDNARWYSPSAGRFTTQDTWAGFNSNPQTLNRYAYALNNPINITEPSGHMPCYEGDDGSLHCGYDPNPDNGGNSYSTNILIFGAAACDDERFSNSTSYLLGKLTGDLYGAYQGATIAVAGGIETFGAGDSVVAAPAVVVTVAQQIS